MTSAMDPASTQQALCLSCGLCCDGTLFGTVPLKAGDDPLPLQAGGIRLQVQQTGQSFKLPCTAYQHGCCQVYANRPLNCVNYRCQLLKRYTRGEVAWVEAQQRIARAKALRETLHTELARIQDSTETSLIAILSLVPTHQALTDDPDLRTLWAPVMLRLSALLDCLYNHFQPPSEHHPAGSS